MAGSLAPEPGCPRLHSGSPALLILSKKGCTDHSSLLRTKFQGAQTLAMALPTNVPETAWSPDSEAPVPLVL